MLARLKTIALLSVCLTIASVIGVIVLNQVNSPESLKKQQDQLTSTYQQSQTKSLAYVQVIDRLNNIQNIINSRSSLKEHLALLQQQIPDGVVIQSLSLDDKAANMTVRASDLEKIDTVISNMNTLLMSKKFLKKLTIEDVVGDQKSGTYSLGIEATL